MIALYATAAARVDKDFTAVGPYAPRCCQRECAI
ncbi:hypothetical protein PKB_1836 [Pseudomonas knackmussii B13]|uniref:Uncharacterized protein n=1 Tax=Pseudomonas knackmussii (strain DSM 6978 / CCUG 54928 / LMG 23759 / B13) TaxID=1301098 RepID=A0A024HEB2_PSEKB|nr:hypothetical protein PKB_1836 [Pseudomonas knackmussii B13]